MYLTGGSANEYEIQEYRQVEREFLESQIDEII